MNGKKAFKTGDYSLHEEALGMYYDAIDKNLLHALIWNYSADNSHADGDGWNGEDLSIFSEGAGRAIEGWRRPYPMATAGDVRELHWDRNRSRYRFRFSADPEIRAPTEIYAPPECFGASPKIEIHGDNSAGLASAVSAEYRADEGRVFIRNEGYRGDLEIIISR
jgi:hypothetical protein